MHLPRKSFALKIALMRLCTRGVVFGTDLVINMLARPMLRSCQRILGSLPLLVFVRASPIRGITSGSLRHRLQWAWVWFLPYPCLDDQGLLHRPTTRARGQRAKDTWLFVTKQHALHTSSLPLKIGGFAHYLQSLIFGCHRHAIGKRSWRFLTRVKEQQLVSTSTAPPPCRHMRWLWIARGMWTAIVQRACAKDWTKIWEGVWRHSQVNLSGCFPLPKDYWMTAERGVTLPATAHEEPWHLSLMPGNVRTCHVNGLIAVGSDTKMNFVGMTRKAHKHDQKTIIQKTNINKINTGAVHENDI